MLLAWVPVLALVQRRVLALVGPWAYLSAVFYFVNVVASLLLGNQLLYRGFLLALNLVMLLTLAWNILLARRSAADEARPNKGTGPDRSRLGCLRRAARVGGFQHHGQRLAGDDAHRRAARQQLRRAGPVRRQHGAGGFFPGARFPARRCRGSSGAMPAR